MSDDLSQLDPTVARFAPASPPSGFTRLRVVNVRQHWEPSVAFGDQRYDHCRCRVTGHAVVDVPVAAVAGLLRSGYEMVS
jgi:hypothetical protein